MAYTHAVSDRWLRERLIALRGVEPQEQAAKRAGIARITLARIETGSRLVSAPHLAALCDAFKVGAKERTYLRALRIKAAEDGWWGDFADVLSEKTADHCELEQEARQIDVYSANLVHGFLQTPRYADLVQNTSGILLPIEKRLSTRRVELRLARQAHVFGQPKTVRVLLDEAVLRRDFGEGITGDQIDHLRRLERGGRIQLRYLPFSGGVLVTANFYLFTVGDRRVVCADAFQVEVHTETEEETDNLAVQFDQWWGLARILP